MRRLVRSEGGFTLIELVVVLAVIALLAAVLTPLVTRYIQDARIARAQNEVNVIGSTIQKFEQDVGRMPFFSVTTASSHREVDQNVSVLQGPGEMPSETTTSDWTGTPSAICGAGSATCARNELADHLIKNTPGGLAANAYATVRSEGQPFVWKGPYLDKLENDPWGNKYLVNIVNARSDRTSATYILSAGPNGKIETDFSPTGGRTINLTPGGDDIIYRIR